MTVSHPWVLHAVASVWSLHAARGYLAEHRDAVLIRRPQLGPASTRPRSLAELQAHDVLLRSERPDRDRLAGARVSSAPAPIAPGLVDLEVTLHAALVDAWMLVSGVQLWRSEWRDPSPWLRLWGSWAGRVWYLDTVLPDCSPATAREVVAILDPIDTQVRSLTGHGPDLWALPMSPPCPVCQQRLLRVRTACPDSARWTVVCGAGCLCRGEVCPCDMTVTAARVPHVWAADHPLVTSALAGVTLAA